MLKQHWIRTVDGFACKYGFVVKECTTKLDKGWSSFLFDRGDCLWYGSWPTAKTAKQAVYAGVPESGYELPSISS